MGIMSAWVRVDPPDMIRAQYPGTRCWQRDVHDGHLSVLVGREPIQRANGDRVIEWHLSISHRTNEHPPQPGRYPSWDEIHEARYRFVPDEITMVMILPPKDQYVNVHSTTFHLWQTEEHA